MHPRLLRTFLAAARHGNMTRAATDLNLTQSSVSEQVQALEEDLGLPVFERSSRGLELTRAGETLLRHAEEVLNVIDEARAAVTAVGETQRGKLAIGSLETIAAGKLARQLVDFQRRFPRIDVGVRIGGSCELLQQLQSGRIDVALCFDKGERDRRFIYRAIADEPVLLIAPACTRWLAVAGDAAALAEMSFIATQQGCIYRKLFEDAFEQAGLEAPKPAAEVGSLQAILRMVVSGAGFTMVPRIAAVELLAQGEVVEIPWPELQPMATIVAIWRRRRIQSAPLSEFLNAVEAGSGPFKPADAHLPRAEPSRW